MRWVRWPAQVTYWISSKQCHNKTAPIMSGNLNQPTWLCKFIWQWLKGRLMLACDFAGQILGWQWHSSELPGNLSKSRKAYPTPTILCDCPFTPSCTYWFHRIRKRNSVAWLHSPGDSWWLSKPCKALHFLYLSKPKQLACSWQQLLSRNPHIYFCMQYVFAR